MLHALMPHVKKMVCVILLVAMPLAIAAQQPRSAVEEKPSLSLQEQKFLSALDQLLEAQKSFADDELKVVTQADIADLLWIYDEARARRLLEDAFARVADKPIGRPWPATQPFYARTMVIKTIARRDPALALKMQQALADGPQNTPTKSATAGNDRLSERARLRDDLTLHVILNNSRNNDARYALEALKAFIERGDFNKFFQFVRTVRHENSKAADELFALALAKIKQGQPSLQDIKNLASHLFYDFGDGVIRFSFAPTKGDPLQPSINNRELVEQFFDLAYNTVIQKYDAALAGEEGARLNARALFDYTIPKLLVPYIEHFLPDRAATFRARVEEVWRRVPPEDRPYLALSGANTQELLAGAETIEDVKYRDSLYQRAASLASLRGEFEQATAIIEKINSEEIRRYQRDELHNRMSHRRVEETYKAFQEKDLERAALLIAEISDWRLRLQAFSNLIMNSPSKDRARAIQMLDEARRAAASVDDGFERAQQLIMLAGIAARVDVNRGFEEMKLAVEEFNRAGFAPEFERFQKTATEERATAKANTGVGVLLNDRDFNWLGLTDFDRAFALAGQFELREASVLAQLAVCRGALTKFTLSSKKPVPGKR